MLLTGSVRRSAESSAYRSLQPLLESCADEETPNYATRSHEIQRIASVSSAFAELRFAQGAGDEARTLLRRAASSIPWPHRCLGLFLQIAVAGTTEDRKWARDMFAVCTARPRLMRACRLLFEALAPCVERPERATRMAAIAAAALLVIFLPHFR